MQIPLAITEWDRKLIVSVSPSRCDLFVMLMHWRMHMIKSEGNADYWFHMWAHQSTWAITAPRTYVSPNGWLCLAGKLILCNGKKKVRNQLHAELRDPMKSNWWLTTRIEPRTHCVAHSRSASLYLLLWCHWQFVTTFLVPLPVPPLAATDTNVWWASGWSECFCRTKKPIALYSIHVAVSLGEAKVVGDSIFSPFHLHLGDKHVSGARFYLFFIKSVCYSSTLAHPLFFTLANCIAPADKSKGNLICPPPRLALAKLFWLRLLFSTGIGRWKKQQKNKLIIFRWAPIRMGLMEGRRYRKGSIYSLQAPHC